MVGGVVLTTPFFAVLYPGYLQAIAASSFQHAIVSVPYQDVWIAFFQQVLEAIPEQNNV